MLKHIAIFAILSLPLLSGRAKAAGVAHGSYVAEEDAKEELKESNERSKSSFLERARQAREKKPQQVADATVVSTEALKDVQSPVEEPKLAEIGGSADAAAKEGAAFLAALEAKSLREAARVNVTRRRGSNPSGPSVSSDAPPAAEAAAEKAIGAK